MRTGKARFSEGDWFAVPLRDGGWAAGRVARVHDETHSIIGYFFGPRVDNPPHLQDVHGLQPSDAVMIRRFGDVALVRGLWPLLGQSEWARETWQVPAFGHQDALSELYFRQTYADEDLGAPPQRVRISGEEWAGLPPAGLHGHGVVEIQLTRALGDSSDALEPSDSTRGLTVIHRILFPSSETARAAAERVPSRFSVTITSGDDRWCLSAQTDLVDVPKTDEDADELRSIAASSHGVYDGWERGQPLRR